MNDFFDTLSAAAKRAADTVSTEVSVAAEEQKVREAYQAIGKLYYQAVKKGAEPTGAEFTELCAKAEAGLKRVAELKAQKNVSDVTAGEEDFVDIVED